MTKPKYDHEFWEQLWSKTLLEHADKVARRPPSAHLMAEAANLSPGRALDAGCGHGADTLWLAARGWQVTAVDFSAAALAHGRSMAEAAGADVARRIDWVEGDLATWFAEKMGRGSFAQSPALIEQLQRHDWPGNVRELRNVVERALSLGDAALADLADHGRAPSSPTMDSDQKRPSNPEVLELPFKEAKAQLVEAFERDYLTALLARHHGNISRAASEAGIDRNYIHRLVKKYGLEVDRS